MTITALTAIRVGQTLCLSTLTYAPTTYLNAYELANSRKVLSRLLKNNHE